MEQFSEGRIDLADQHWTGRPYVHRPDVLADSILNLLDEDSRMTIREIADRLDKPKSTIHRSLLGMDLTSKSSQLSAFNKCTETAPAAATATAADSNLQSATLASGPPASCTHRKLHPDSAKNDNLKETTAAGSSTITRTRSLATIPTVVQPARLHQRNQKRRARAPAAGSNKEPLPCLEQFLARSLTQVMQNRPSSGWSAERHAYAVEKVTCWLPEVGKARCLDDLLANESEAEAAVWCMTSPIPDCLRALSILRTKVQRDFGLTQEDSHSFITSPNCLSMLSCRSLRAPQTSPSSNRPSATASSRSLHCSSMREDSSNTPRRSLALSAAAIELSNSCSTAKSLSFCLAASSSGSAVDFRHSFLVLHQRLNSGIEQILSHLQLRLQHLHVRSQTVADEPQRAQPWPELWREVHALCRSLRS
uniref:HTH iclR-type domain-containing protein n=1 Tax=Macrostomum lignano TaxID=282301 RepID=A0A1I8FCJ0_9PLAT